MFVDDLSVRQELDRSTPLAECKAKLAKCETQMHKWGQQNRASLDTAKERSVILHPSEHHGKGFKLPGCMIHPDLHMHSAVEQVLSKIRPENKAILRSRGYSTSNFIL